MQVKQDTVDYSVYSALVARVAEVVAQEIYGGGSGRWGRWMGWEVDDTRGGSAGVGGGVDRRGGEREREVLSRKSRERWCKKRVMLLYMLPHTTVYVSLYSYMCPHTTTCVLILL